MYCSTCGNTINPGLSFCNNCGTKVGSAKESVPGQVSEASFNLLISMLFATPIAGIGIIIGLMAAMKARLGFGDEMIGIIVFMSFVLLLIAELGLIWLLTRYSRSEKIINPKAETQIPQLNDVVIKGLPQSRMQPIYEPVTSVTEHTTRTLNKVPREQKPE